MENNTYKPEYRWIITKDRIKDPDAKEGTNSNAKGVQGPYDCDETLKTNPNRFSLYDDDGICYAEGMLYGEYSGLEPLDDYGEGNWGCVAIKMDGEFLNCIPSGLQE